MGKEQYDPPRESGRGRVMPHVVWGTRDVFPRFYRIRPEYPQTGHELYSLRKEGERTAQFQKNKPINLLIWNVHKFASPQAAWELYALQSQFDVIALQEYVHNSSDTAFHERILKDHDADLSVSYFLKHNGKLPTGVATISRHEAISAQAFHSPQREPFVLTPKSALFTTYEVADSQPLGVLNVHGILARPTKNIMHQFESIAQAHQGPLIICGDFNTLNIQRKHTLSRFAATFGMEEVPFTGRTQFGRHVVDHALIRDVEVNISGADISNASDHNKLFMQVYIK